MTLRNKIVSALLSGIASCFAVYGLFLASEEKIHHDNNFTRRFPHAPVSSQKEIDLGYNSFYFAGSTGNSIYLGNHTAPLRIWEVDTALRIKAVHVIELDKGNLPFSSVQVRIAAPYFFLGDGTVSAIYRGKISDWKAKLAFRKRIPFSYFAPLDSLHIAIRGMNRKAQNILGLITLDSARTVSYYPNILQKQMDGIFDTDGVLVGDSETKKSTYVYFYRNEFMTADGQMRLVSRGKTIDTTSRAKIQVTYIEDRKERKLSAPPLIVNKAVATKRDLLFVNSQLADRYQSDEVWKQSSTIDVYDLRDQSYQLSFYLYDVHGNKLRNFFISDTHVYALMGNYLVCAKLNEPIRKLFKKYHP